MCRHDTLMVARMESSLESLRFVCPSSIRMPQEQGRTQTTESVSEPGAHLFNETGWPASRWDPPSVPTLHREHRRMLLHPGQPLAASPALQLCVLNSQHSPSLSIPPSCLRITLQTLSPDQSSCLLSRSLFPQVSLSNLISNLFFVVIVYSGQ